MNLKFLAFEMVLFFFFKSFTSSSDHPQGKEKTERRARLTQKIPAIKGPFISCIDYKVSLMTVSRICPAL